MGEGDYNPECLRWKHQEIPVDLQDFWHNTVNQIDTKTHSWGHIFSYSMTISTKSNMLSSEEGGQKVKRSNYVEL